MSKWTPGDFIIISKGENGIVAEVRTGIIKWPFAISQTTIMKGYTLTHITSGYRIADRDTIAQCQRLAAQLRKTRARWNTARPLDRLNSAAKARIRDLAKGN